eukprot:1156368-Pelagomonas_calceolata.AAC.6
MVALLMPATSLATSLLLRSRQGIQGHNVLSACMLLRSRQGIQGHNVLSACMLVLLAGNPKLSSQGSGPPHSRAYLTRAQLVHCLQAGPEQPRLVHRKRTGCKYKFLPRIPTGSAGQKPPQQQQ